MSTQTFVDLICDEAAVLGDMKELKDIQTMGRSAGIRGQSYYQSLGQPKGIWKDDAQTIMSNCTKCFVGVNTIEEAKLVSDMLGDFTQVVESGGKSTSSSSSYTEAMHSSTSYSRSTNHTQNWQQAGRKLLMPDEVLRASERTCFTFVPGLPPIKTTLIRAYEEPHLIAPPCFWREARQALGVLFYAAVWLAFAVLSAALLVHNMNVSP
jgi:type IV secretory pathway TraG/TraD family ATPase VirD4